ncbi:MAG: phosphonate ABC transporter, permease protein PhnE [Pseudomonadota bacterium]
MNTLTQDEFFAIRKRNPDAFKQPFWKQFAAPIAVGVCIVYTIYCFWFFSIAKTVSEGNWEIAGAYLADWVSYEARPDIDYRTGEILIEWPRFSPLGEDPDPSWIETETGAVNVIVKRAATPSSPTTNNNASGAAGSFMSPNSPATSTGNGSDAAPAPSGPADSGFSFMSPNSSATSTGTGGASSTGNGEPATIVETREGINRAVIEVKPGAQIVATPDLVTVSYQGSVLEVAVDPEANIVTPLDPLPDWALQKSEGLKVFLNFGFGGRAEIRAKEIKVNKRFFGWENFVFDTESPYWGMSFGEVATHLYSGPRLDETMSNWSLMWNNIIYNSEWQHGDVWIKLLQTIVMAFVGTLFACLVAFPLSFFAARNITPNFFVNQILKRFFDFLRSVDMLIWALFFTRAFGPGPLAGISAIFFTDTGTFGKLYSEALENIDDKQREGVKSVGASPTAVQRYGVVPQVLPIFASQALYFWESNTRSATIIGAVGAGGIGLKLWEAMRTNQDWENVAYMVILILVVVFIFDNVSGALRSRLIGKHVT